MQELISVIVPIYKVEQYLTKCLDSLINQTYRNLEIILVDDGSPDNCPRICDEYARKDSRIKVIHQENAGLSAARNSGLDVATGDYIGFVDSDDSVDVHMYEFLLRNIKKNEADLAICRYQFISKDGNVKYDNMNQLVETTSVCSGYEALKNLYKKDLVVPTVVAWNKLYKKDLFKNIRYEVGKIHEDEYIIHQILDRSKKVVYSNLPLYIYLPRDSSITGQKFNLRRLDCIEALEKRIIYYKERQYKDLCDKEFGNYFNMLIFNYYMIQKFCPEEKQVAIEIRSKFLNLYKNKRWEGLSKTSKIKYNLFSFSPFLCEKVINLWNKSSYSERRID